MIVKVSLAAGTKLSVVVSVPPSVVLPVTTSWSYCEPAVVPPISTASVPNGPCA